ncbi:MAG: hypothetical protein NT076_02530 [Candidatus Pacearchaeota archaeon]|nr:hypothetical protein [Candidatus Pacearchaeota archaeon]
MTNGFRSGNEVFLSYKNDDGSVKSGFFILSELKDNFVIVKTQMGSELLIPISQVLKIKLKEEK